MPSRERPAELELELDLDPPRKAKIDEMGTQIITEALDLPRVQLRILRLRSFWRRDLSPGI